jgi:hypothetical protein
MFIFLFILCVITFPILFGKQIIFVLPGCLIAGYFWFRVLYGARKTNKKLDSENIIPFKKQE